MADSKSVKYFNEIAVENRDDLVIIGTMARKEILDKFKINLGHDETAISIYACIFDAIRDVLKDMESKKDSYSINIANRLEIGYTSSFDGGNGDELEKKGNFAMYLRHIPNSSLTEMDENEPKSVVLCTQWNALNITSSIEAVKKIAKRSLVIMNDRLAINIASPEVIMPVFCTIHQKMVQYIMIKRSEEDCFEYRINMCGCFEAFCRQMDDGVDIVFKPSIYDKGHMKDDGNASIKFE